MNDFKNYVNIGTYGLPWLDSVLEENLLPGAPWNKVKDEIESRLAVEVRNTTFSDKQLNLAVRQLLGWVFVEKYLKTPSSSPLTNGVQSPIPNEEHFKEAKVWLHSKIQKVSSELGFEQVEEMVVEETMPQAMMEWRTFMHDSVRRGMENELFVEEERKTDRYKEDTRRCKAVENSRREKHPAFGSFQSEILGKAVGAILQHDHSKIERICLQLYGKQLPNSLRKIIWKMCLSKAKLPMNDLHRTRTESENKVECGASIELDSAADSSPLESVIKHTVKQMYRKTPGLGPCLVTGKQEDLAVKAMNCFYINKNIYEPRHVLLLYPLVCTFGDSDVITGAQLAGLLVQLLENCFPTRPQLFSLADNVLERLYQEDEQLFTHLVRVTREKSPSDHKEFLVNYIQSELEQAQTFDKSLSDNVLQTLSRDSKDLLCHPIIFLRKWIGEGFVSVLRCSAFLFVWDQCFLSGWRPSVMINTCLVLVQLLRDQLMTAECYHDIRCLLLDRPSSLYTHDIQQGLLYLENGGALQDVANVTRATRPRSTISLASSVPVSSSAHLENLDTAGDELTVDTEESIHSAADDADQQQLGPLWLPRTKSASVAKDVANNEQFDICIDEVRFIPDNAMIIKVKGRIMCSDWQKPAKLESSHLEAFPELSSPARCPQFKFKYPVQVPSEGLPVDSVLVLRVYTLDVGTGQQVVIGNCAVGLYFLTGDQIHLRVGNYQKRLKHLLPSSSVPPSEETFAEQYSVPCASILIRLRPHSEEFVEPPGYESGYYQSENCKPTESETRVYKHFCTVGKYPLTVREAIYDVREGEEGEDIPTTSDVELVAWYKDRLAQYRLQGEPAAPIDLTEAVTYEQEMGIAIKVEQAFGLPDGLFTNALVYINSGVEIRQPSVTSEQLGRRDDKMVTNIRSFDSQQKSPRWLDEPKVFHPIFNSFSSVVIRLYAVDGVYTRRADHAGPGSVSGRKKDQNPILVSQGWTVLQLFNKSCVNAGIHHLPLFQGSPSSAFMEFLTSHGADYSLREAIQQKFHRPQGTSSIVVRIWDAHYSLDESIPLPLKDSSLTIGNPDKYKKTAEAGGGKLISQIVLNTLTRQERKKGTFSQQYMEEKAFYEEAMNNTFLNLMENILLQSGLGPVT